MYRNIKYDFWDHRESWWCNVKILYLEVSCAIADVTLRNKQRLQFAIED